MLEHISCLVKVCTMTILLIYINSLVDSTHGGAYGVNEVMKPLDQQYQFFGAIRFPVTEETEAWKEKVRAICSWYFCMHSKNSHANFVFLKYF